MEGKKPLWRKALVGGGIAAGGVLAVLVTLQIVLTPAVATRLVNKYAPQFLDGDLSFGAVELSVFRNFPNLGLTLNDAVLTYPHDRYAGYEDACSARLMALGRNEEADTLASFKEFHASLNVLSLLGKTIDVPVLELAHARAFAKSYADSVANWNVFRSSPEPEDTTKSVLPRIKVGKVVLSDNPRVVFCIPRDTLFTTLDFDEMSFRGNVVTDDLWASKGKLAVDSLHVAGRFKADTLLFGLDNLALHGNRDKLGLHISARAFAATESFGRVSIPLKVDAMAHFPEDSVLSVCVHKCNVDVAGIPLHLTGDAKVYDDKYYVKAEAGIDGCRVSPVLKDFVVKFWDGATDIDTDAKLFLNASCDGCFVPSTGEIPALEAKLTIPDSYVKYAKVKNTVDLDLEVDATATPSRMLDVEVSNFKASSGSMKLDFKGGAKDLLGEDPLLNAAVLLAADLDDVEGFLPESLGLDLKGKLEADVSGELRMSQLNLARLSDADITGHLDSDRIDVLMASDTISGTLKNLAVRLAAEGNRYDKAMKQGGRVLTLSVDIDSVAADIKHGLFANVGKLSVKAHNSADILDASNRGKGSVPPFAGLIAADRISVRDADSLAVFVKETRNTFTIRPKEGEETVPVLKLNSGNKAVMLRSGVNRARLSGLSLNATASRSAASLRLKSASTRRTAAAGASAPVSRRSSASDAKVAASSGTRTKGRAVRTTGKMQASQDDLAEGDINISLSGALRNYYRQWDLSGGISLDEGNIVTPFFPLKNRISTLKGSFTNDKVTLSSFTLQSGESDISAKGSISNLKNALLRKGIFKMDLKLSSDVLNANELLAAYDAGSKYKPTDAAVAKADAMSDEKFEQMVVKDNLAESENEGTLIIVPANVEANLLLEASRIIYSTLDIDWMESDIKMKDRTVQITNTCATSNMGDIYFEGFYSTKSRRDVKAGFYLNLVDITAEKVIALMPAVDTIIPLLKSFSGMLDCTLAATTALDDRMNILIPSLNGVMRISGKDLEINENEDIYKIAKTLMFRNKKKVHVDRMSVEGLVSDSKIEVFPFLLNIDRYKLALSGIQNMDTSFKYHISLIKSPIWFKFGVDFNGDFDKWKWRLGRAKYRNAKKVPVFSSVIDETTLNLTKSINTIFEKGVEIAVAENEAQKSISDYKESTGYIAAVDMQMDTLSLRDSKRMEKMEALQDAADSLGIDLDSLAVGKVDSLALVQLESMGFKKKDIDELAASAVEEDD